MGPRSKPSGRAGRRPSTSRDELGSIGVSLFHEHGFDETSVDDIAAAAGIGRRTFFRYYPSKNAVPWGDFDAHLDLMRAHLRELSPDLDLADALASALLEFNTFPESEAVTHRNRMNLIMRVPALQAYSAVMYQDWRRVVAEFVAERAGLAPTDHFPRTVAHLALAVSISAYEQWLDDESTELHDLLAQGMRTLYSGVTDAVPATGVARS